MISQTIVRGFKPSIKALIPPTPPPPSLLSCELVLIKRTLGREHFWEIFSVVLYGVVVFSLALINTVLHSQFGK